MAFGKLHNDNRIFALPANGKIPHTHTHTHANNLISCPDDQYTVQGKPTDDVTPANFKEPDFFAKRTPPQTGHAHFHTILLRLKQNE